MLQLHACIFLQATTAGICMSLAPFWLLRNNYLINPDKTIVALNSITELISNAGAIVAMPSVGYLCDRIGKQNVITLGLLIASIHPTLLLMPNASPIAMAVFYASAILQTWISVFNIVMSDVAQSISNVTILINVYSLGNVFGASLVSFVISLIPNATIVPMLALAANAGAMCLYHQQKEQEEEEEEQEEEEKEGDVRKNMHNIGIHACTLGSSFVLSAMYNMLPQFLISHLGFTPVDLSLLNTISFAGGIACKSMLLVIDYHSSSTDAPQHRWVARAIAVLANIGLGIQCVIMTLARNKKEAFVAAAIGSTSAFIWPCLTMLKSATGHARLDIEQPLVERQTNNNNNSTNVSFGIYEGMAYLGNALGSMAAGAIFIYVDYSNIWSLLAGIQYMCVLFLVIL